jgi:hypothetical protein
MTKRLQIRIMAGFILVLLLISGVFGYNKYLHSANAFPSSNTSMKGILYRASDTLPIFELRWEKDVKSKSALNKNNYLVEQVVPRKGKWLTAVNGKKCNISFVQHVINPKYDSKAKVTQLSVSITPKPEPGDFYRVRARNLEFKEGGKMDHVEYAVTEVSSYNNLAK